LTYHGKMPVEQFNIRLDCRYFPGDRPCAFHKREAVRCEACSHYAGRGIKILIIKFDALGDVLRTTSLLPSLRKQHGSTYVTWITSQDAAPLFIGNPYVDEVLTTCDEYLPVLLNRVFDIVINPDASRKSCELASLATAETKYGFVSSPLGTVVPLDDAALRWLRMGSDDVVKRENRQTYQQIIHDMCHLDASSQHIVIALTDDEKARREELRRDLELDPQLPTIGINAGAGDRWQHKKWSLHGYIDLISIIREEMSAQVLILGGPADDERNRLIKARAGGGAYYRPTSSLRELIQLIDLCDVVVTGDTLAAHIAVGLAKRVVVIFGPTSAAEVDLYGLGEKIVAPVDCVCCYRSSCDRKPNCMELIDAEVVFDALKRQVRLSGAKRLDEVEILVGEPGR